MQEFTSISVSSYDAASLADKLTEKSSAGWDVVAIVPAGTNITAYLCRASDGAETAPSWDSGSDDVGAASDDVAAEPASDVYAAGVITTSADAPADVEEPAPVWEPEPVAEEPAPVEEPAGWAVAPEPASPSAETAGVAEATPEATPYVPSGDYGAGQPAAAPETEYTGEPRLGSSTAGYDSGTTDDSPTPAYETGVSTGAAAAEPGYESAATTEPSSGYEGAAATAAAAGSGYDAGVTAESSTVASSESASGGEQAATAAASAAPAGWYADPSGRYELRYWDGNQWTEHVSRAGQQYTDPPVA